MANRKQSNRIWCFEFKEHAFPNAVCQDPSRFCKSHFREDEEGRVRRAPVPQRAPFRSIFLKSCQLEENCKAFSGTIRWDVLLCLCPVGPHLASHAANPLGGFEATSRRRCDLSRSRRGPNGRPWEELWLAPLKSGGCMI